MSDLQTASLIGGLVLLTAVGTRYFIGRPSSHVKRDAFYWALIVAAIAVGYGLYSAVVAA